MNKIIQFIAGLLLTTLVACGGGGGNPGSKSSSSGSSTGTSTTGATLTLALFDANGLAVNAVAATGYTTAKASVKDSTGLAISNKLVSFSNADGLLAFPQGTTALTGTDGTASIQVSRASLSSNSAGSIGASTVVSGATVSTSVDFQLATAAVSLSALNLGVSNLDAYGTLQVSVQVLINGVAATATPVQLVFAADCGTIAPTTVLTDTSGNATTTYTANGTQGCSGKNVAITATSSGQTKTSTLSINVAKATNIQFVSAKPTTIYLSGVTSSTASNQSELVFKVLNAQNVGQFGQSVLLELTNPNVGVSFGSKGNTSRLSYTTDSLGEVKVPVFAGTVPTSAQVKATLASDSSVNTQSSVLTVASGRPVQSRASLVSGVAAIEGFSRDDANTTLTFAVSDRQGNPVPDGTSVNFTIEAGKVDATCLTSGSRCTVTLMAQGTRPVNGRVSVLAYVVGEEDFVDANGNNIYDLGETFTDLGNAFRDDDEAGYSTGEFYLPRSGAVTCTGGESGKPNTCDGVWGEIDVRKQIVVVFATSSGVITVNANTTRSINFTVADLNGNSMATGSTIEAVPLTTTNGCTVSDLSRTEVPNRLSPVTVVAALDSCATGDVVRLKVTSPLSSEITSTDVTLP